MSELSDIQALRGKVDGLRLKVSLSSHNIDMAYNQAVDDFLSLIDEMIKEKMAPLFFGRNLMQTEYWINMYKIQHAHVSPTAWLTEDQANREFNPAIHEKTVHVVTTKSVIDTILKQPAYHSMHNIIKRDHLLHDVTEYRSSDEP